MTDTRDQTTQGVDDAARPSAQEARQGRNGPQILIVLCASVGLLVSAYIAMLAFAGA
jgi:hypothetical protein